MLLKIRVATWDFGTMRFTRLEELDAWTPGRFDEGGEYEALASLREDLKRFNGPKDTDPIFGEIEKFRKLFKAWLRQFRALDNAEHKARKKHGQRLIPLIAWRNYSAISGSEIDNAREKFLALPAIDPKKIEAEYRDAKARERASIRAEHAWDRRAGLAKQRSECERASEAYLEQSMRMALHTGWRCGTLTSLVWSEMEMEENWSIEWHAVALTTVINALAPQQGADLSERNPAYRGQ
jgi:hypothetical protein